MTDSNTTPLTGRCLCGTITYEVTGDVLATAVCHCEHCQRQSGGAFSVNLVVHESQLAVDGELSIYTERGENDDGEYVARKFCGGCGSPIVSALLGTEGIVAVKAGTLDDTSSVAPGVQAWCDHKQPWVALDIAVSMDRE